MTYGSSPRTWGTAGFQHPHLVSDRFIPTHVGNSQPLRATWRPCSVHPHARGEQTVTRIFGDDEGGSSPRTWGTGLGWLTNSELIGGSSPRTWGTVDGLRNSVHAVRFIPTHVGNSRLSGLRSRSTTVHPHARGEQALVHAKQLVVARFIPTHVGNSSARSRCARQSAVHPHARGEQGQCAYVISLEYGSSPRTWGTGSRSPGR